MISQVHYVLQRFENVCLRFPLLAPLTALLALSTVVATAQISAGSMPYSFQQTIASAIPTASMPPTDLATLLAEDELAAKDEPYRFGYSHDVHLNLENSGNWMELPDGSRLWQLRITSAGAYTISLLYDDWFIPDGCDLFIYNEARDFVIGAFTSFNNWVDGTNITQPVWDDVTILEYHETAAARGQSRLSISNVVHAYRNVFGRSDANPLDNYGDSGTCNNNVNCPEGALWQTNKRGVAMILTSGGSRICTGSLVNNTNQDQTPYFLTANHCLGGSSTWQFMFNYESPGCTNQNGPTNQTVSNSTLRANWSGSDFALLQLSSAVPAAYNPYYNGWNRVDAAATNSVCIHHPSGDIKKITFDNNAPVSSTWSGTPANSHWRILAWEDGTTEPGSSGSPLFDQNHRITGQLHGGTASCSNNIDDYFGKFSLSWTGNNSNSTRLSNWLDPAGTAPTVLDGLDGSAASITVTAPNGGETWVEGEARNITWTSSGVTGNVNIELNRNYPGGAWESIVANTANDGTHSWTVTLPASVALARVRITSVNAPTVTDVSNSNFTIAARSITVTSPNGGETWIEGEARNITWTSLGLTGNLNIELSRNGGGSWETIVSNTANDGTHSWTVTLPATSTALVRITSISFPAVTDQSNANFTLAARTITVTSPNGGEVWVEGEGRIISWASQNLTGNVNIELNRTYPGGAWESIAANTANDGTHTWNVTLPATALARIRITSVSFPTVSDVSDNNFTLAARTITVVSPNGGESWIAGTNQTISWTSQNVSGNVNVELNRNYPGGGWESIALNSANDGSEVWTVSTPVSTLCRVRVTSASFPTVSDVSNNNFTILQANIPANVAHDPLDDQAPAPFTVTAIVTDDAGGFATKFHYYPVGGGPYDSLNMSATGNPSEYAAAVPALAEDFYGYYLRTIDAGGLVTQTDTFFFEVRQVCGDEISYDDGVAEASHWSQSIGYKWAVRFSPPATPYSLCQARVGVSAVNPDDTHWLIHVQVFLADGIGGAPGTAIADKYVGSIGNEIGGVPADPASFADVLLRDGSGVPLQINGDFYVAVSNPEMGKYEAFLHDTSSAPSGRSYVYDPCDSLWISEEDLHGSARSGNRMIRVLGHALLPPAIVIQRSGNDIRLDWTSTGAPYYRVYDSATADGPFTNLIGSTSANTFIDAGAVAGTIKFYLVRSSSQP